MDLFTFRCLSVVLAALVLAVETAGQLPKPENLRWSSTNFKTLLTWGPKADEHTYSVQYAERNGDWLSPPNCLHIPETECDLTNVFSPKRTYSAMVTTDSTEWSYDEDTHLSTRSEYFNPYRQSEITAVSFTLEAHGASGGMVLHIKDPLTNIYQDQRMLTIRDVFQKDLRYKISYQQVGSTRKHEVVRESNVAVVDDLKPQHRYCFSVAAYIPSRDTQYQLGAWSQHQCSQADWSAPQELSVEALVGGTLILLLLLLFIIITSVLCCRRHRRRQHQTAQALQTA